MNRLILSIMILLTAFSALLPQVNIPVNDKTYIDSLMNFYYGGNKPGAVILASSGNDILFRKAYGMASLELSVPMNEDMIFPLGSIIKQFTAVSILRLVEENKISLKDDIRKYLPEYNTHGKLITIENLLTHTSGIMSIYERPDYQKIKCSDYSRSEMLKLFIDEPLNFDPGTNWHYSNSGYTLAALIIEKISNLSFDEYIKKNILIPLQMTHTRIAAAGDLYNGMPPYYRPRGENSYRQGPQISWSLFLGAGDLISSVDDMLKWNTALISGKLINSKLLEKAWNSFILPDGRKTNYGYGWSTGSYKGIKIVQHDGIMGYLSDAVCLPEKNIYLIIATNNGSISPNEIVNDIAFRLSGSPLISEPSRHVNKSELKEYIGAYEISLPFSRNNKPAAAKQYRYITASGDTLFAQRSGNAKYKLFNVDTDLFCFEGTTTYIKFLRDHDGKVIALDFFSLPVNYGPDDIEMLDPNAIAENL